MDNRPLKCILLVDDNVSINMVNSRYIKKLCVADEVVAVTNGKAALDYLETELPAEHKPDCLPDLIVLDLNMPVMDGFEFLKAFRELPEEYKTCRIIILSSSNRVKEIEDALSFEEVEDYWIKPIRKENWLSLLEPNH